MYSLIIGFTEGSALQHSEVEIERAEEPVEGVPKD